MLKTGLKAGRHGRPATPARSDQGNLVVARRASIWATREVRAEVDGTGALQAKTCA
jgi:hypothetical protein